MHTRFFYVTLFALGIFFLWASIALGDVNLFPSKSSYSPCCPTEKQKCDCDLIVGVGDGGVTTDGLLKAELVTARCTCRCPGRYRPMNCNDAGLCLDSEVVNTLDGGCP